MQIQLPIRQALAACLALLCMVSLNWIGFYAHMHLGLAMTALGKLALSLLSLSLGFYVYSKRMKVRREAVVSAWHYFIILLLSDIFTTYFLSEDQGINTHSSINFNALALAGALSCMYLLYAKKIKSSIQ